MVIFNSYVKLPEGKCSFAMDSQFIHSGVAIGVVKINSGQWWDILRVN